MADWPQECTVADNSMAPIVDRETHRCQPVLVVVEVVALLVVLLVVHWETQKEVVPWMAHPEIHMAADPRVVCREIQRALVVGYSRWGLVASQVVLEAVGEEGCSSCGRTSRCRRGQEVEPQHEGEQAPDCSRAAAHTKVGKREREVPR